MSSIEGLVQHMQFQWQRHEVLSNNLSNISTPGFKRDDVAIVPEWVAASTNNANLLPLQGGGAVLQWTDFSQGFIQGTGRSLDAASNGPGFFVVQTPAGLRFTRSGGFTVSPNGTLVGPTGSPVLGQSGPITLASSTVIIGPGGEVNDNGRVVDKLRVVDFPKPYRLVKEGGGLYAVANPTVEPTDATGFEITGGALEASNVTTVQMMVSMIDVLRTYEAAQRAMQAVEDANRHATSDIGKVS
jgi:flagellar basal-body rod protein FlgF